jgi:hypothetical protein
MRRSLLPLLVLSLSTTVFAQDPDPYAGEPRPVTVAPTGQKGTISIDAMTTPGRHFGMGFYVTDHLSLRPTIGLGYSDFSGMMVNVGADLRYDFSPDRDWSLYAMGSAYYEGGNDPVYSSRPPTGSGYQDYTSVSSYDGFYYGAGLGVRRRVGDRFAVMLDGRYLHTANSVSGSSFGLYAIDGQNSVVASLGLSFYLK